MNLISGTGRAGSAIATLTLAKALKNSGHRIIIVSPAGSFTEEISKKYCLENVSFESDKKIDFKLSKRLVDYCLKENIDIVNANESRDRILSILMKIMGLKSKIVITRHTIPGTFPFLGYIPYNLWSDMHIAVSNAVYQKLVKSGLNKNKVVVIYNGIDVDSFTSVSKEKGLDIKQKFFPFPSSIPVIGIVGRYHGEPVSHKGYHILFKALAELENDYRLIILGPYKDADINGLKNIAGQIGLGGNKIIFCGFQEEIAYFYHNMDILVHPSISEGMGRVVLEAMACKVPCICSWTGGLKEIINNGKNGLTFSPDNHIELRDKIRLLLENLELRKSLSMKGYTTVKEKFDIIKISRETENIFMELIKN